MEHNMQKITRKKLHAKKRALVVSKLPKRIPFNPDLTDREVELVRRLHEGGMDCAAIGRKFDKSRWTIHQIVSYRRR